MDSRPQTNCNPGVWRTGAIVSLLLIFSQRSHLFENVRCQICVQTLKPNRTSIRSSASTRSSMKELRRGTVSLPNPPHFTLLQSNCLADSFSSFFPLYLLLIPESTLLSALCILCPPFFPLSLPDFWFSSTTSAGTILTPARRASSLLVG